MNAQEELIKLRQELSQYKEYVKFLEEECEFSTETSKRLLNRIQTLVTRKSKFHVL